MNVNSNGYRKEKIIANDNEWIKVQRDLFKYNGKIGHGTANGFIKKCQKDPKFLAQAKERFWNNGLYYATNKDVVDFINKYNIDKLEEEGEF